MPGATDDTSGTTIDLIRGAKDGDAGARDALVGRILPQLQGFFDKRCGARIRNKESVSDLVQSVCREALEDLPDFRGNSEPEFRGWLFTLAQHKILDRSKHWSAARRDAARERAIDAATVDGGRSAELLGFLADSCTPSQDVSAREEVERIERAFEELPEDYREIISLACVRRMSHAEIARHLGKAETAVRKMLSRARARLSRLLAQTEPD